MGDYSKVCRHTPAIKDSCLSHYLLYFFRTHEILNDFLNTNTT